MLFFRELITVYMLFVEFQRYFIDNISDQYTNIHSFHINHAGGFVHAGEYGDVA